MSVTQVDNQLLGTTQPVMLCLTPNSSESTVVDSGPALQVNAVKVPSSLMLTELFKVNPCLRCMSLFTIKHFSKKNYLVLCCEIFPHSRLLFHFG